jgi:SAM-dependent methyltransferase
LLDGVELRAGMALLDVACGTGIVARIARDRARGDLRGVGVDRNPAMLDVARRITAAIDWREGDAAALPIGDERFDVVCCHQGLQFIPDKAAAVHEMRRALAPGGVVAVGVWRSLEENGLFNDLGNVAEEFVGPIADARHSFADARTLASLFEGAGFREIVVEPVALDVRFEIDASILVRLNAMAVVGMSSVGKTIAEAERRDVVDRIIAASHPVVTRYVSGNAIVFPTAANIAIAR